MTLSSTLPGHSTGLRPTTTVPLLTAAIALSLSTLTYAQSNEAVQPDTSDPSAVMETRAGDSAAEPATDIATQEADADAVVLEQQLGSVQQEADKLRRDAAKQQQAAEQQIASLNEELRTAHEKLSKQTAELEQLRSQNNTLDTELVSVTATLDTLQKETSELRGELAALKTSMESLGAEHDEAVKQQQAEAERNAELDAQIQALSAERDQAHAQSEQLAQEKAQLQESLDTAEARRKELGIKSATEGKTAASLKAELAQLKKEFDETREQAAAANTLTGQLASAEDNNAELRSKLATAEQALVDAQARAGKLEQDAGALQQQLQACDEKLSQAQTMINPAAGGTANLDSARANATSAQQAVSQLMADPSADPLMLADAQRQLFAAQSLVAQLSSAQGTVTVKPGETLSTIAAQYYGSGSKWSRIHQANTHVLPNPNRLEPGMVLVLP